VHRVLSREHQQWHPLARRPPFRKLSDMVGLPAARPFPLEAVQARCPVAASVLRPLSRRSVPSRRRVRGPRVRSACRALQPAAKPRALRRGSCSLGAGGVRLLRSRRPPSISTSARPRSAVVGFRAKRRHPGRLGAGSPACNNCVRCMLLGPNCGLCNFRSCPLVGTAASRLGEQLCCLIDAADSLGKGCSRSFEPPWPISRRQHWPDRRSSRMRRDQ
jgi:hypothetical protein